MENKRGCKSNKRRTKRKQKMTRYFTKFGNIGNYKKQRRKIKKKCIRCNQFKIVEYGSSQSRGEGFICLDCCKKKK